MEMWGREGANLGGPNAAWRAQLEAPRSRCGASTVPRRGRRDACLVPEHGLAWLSRDAPPPLCGMAVTESGSPETN